MARIADVVLCPACAVSATWNAGELTVARGSIWRRDTALTALQALRASLNVRERERARAAICCSVEDDFHEMPVQVAALTLEAQGWGVVNLGTSTPFYAVSEAVARFNPRLICVASTVFNHTDRAAREYGEFSGAARRVGASVVWAARGSGRGHAAQFPADLHAENILSTGSHAAALGAAARTRTIKRHRAASAEAGRKRGLEDVGFATSKKIRRSTR